MLRLVLVRHGESEWNRENRFTGWTDVGLSEKGLAEAKEAGRLLKEQGFEFKASYTSYLSRAIKTLWIILEEMDLMYIPLYKSWRLNEKHYGALQGLNKTEMAEKYGEQQILMWRRSYNVPPPLLAENDPRNSKYDPRYVDLADQDIPRTETLKDVVDRMLPFWKEQIVKTLMEKKEVIVAAHGNSLRAVIMYLKNMTEREILDFNIPTGVPYVFEFDDKLNLKKDYYLGDPEEVAKRQLAVAQQGKKK
jgi:2,3-bisphosphoglycerate-dependent phosphoglycerate mutase